MDILKFGIIGIGNMGSGHCLTLFNKKVPNAKLTAVCDISPKRLEWAKDNFGDTVSIFDNSDAFFDSKAFDCVLIAVPHYDHPALAIKAFEHGYHVLVEKPAGVYTRQVREMNEAAEKSNLVFGIMYNQRTNPVFQKMRDLVHSGELGQIRRTNYIIDWYRSQVYYNSGGWRATWAGEGGGVLLNQDPHQLDIWQWILGSIPKRVRGFCHFGKMHDIEVEDEVTAYMEFENGATGVFITSTYQSPGTNRLEISGDMGKLVMENNELTFWRNRINEREFNATNKESFSSPEVWKIGFDIEGSGLQHLGILCNYTNAVLKGEKLLAPGYDGIRGLSISNAIHLSTWLDGWVNLPVNEDLFINELNKRINTSTFKKHVDEKISIV